MLSSVQQQQQQLDLRIESVPEFLHHQQKQTKNFRTTQQLLLNEEEEEQDEYEDDFYYYHSSQHLNSSSLLVEEYDEDLSDQELFEQEEEQAKQIRLNFEIANRAFYVTINKFTRQNYPNNEEVTTTKRRSAPYTFLQNWHLHNIYSKSQQTLLGITPVRPQVLLSGDDFMFTPPFHIEQQDCYEEEEEEEEAYYYSQQLLEEDEEEEEEEFYTLSPCPNSSYCIEEETTPSLSLFETFTPNNNNDKQQLDYYHVDQENIWLASGGGGNIVNEITRTTTHNFNEYNTLTLCQGQEEEEEEQDNLLYITDSSSLSTDEQEEENETVSLSSYNLLNLYTSNNSQEEEEEDKVTPYTSPISTRSSIFNKSQKSSSMEEETSSITSYQSLADIIKMNSPSSVVIEIGEAKDDTEEEQQKYSISKFSNYGSSTATTNSGSNDRDTIKEQQTAATHRNDQDVELGNTAKTKKQQTTFILYIMSILHLFINLISFPFSFLFFSNNEEEAATERDPLL